MPIFKTYNLKLSISSYYKLKEIEIKIEKEENQNFTKSEIVEKLIENYDL